MLVTEVANGQRKTICSYPWLLNLVRRVSGKILTLRGWQLPHGPATPAKYVLILAPHTSNWDFLLMLLVVLKLRLELYWMGKNSLFPFGIGWLMRWLGGISIDRAKSHNVVNETVRQYREHESLVILIPPEGTRSKVTTWKSGFYHIANMVEVPILLGYVDAANKEAGLVGFFTPTGDIEKDMQEIRTFYANKKGLRADNS